MKTFNFFEEALNKSIKFGKYYHVLALEGDMEVYNSDEIYHRGGYFRPEKDTDRKRMSDQHTKAQVLVYDSSSESLDWKSVYKNSKGCYFFKSKAIYIKLN